MTVTIRRATTEDAGEIAAVQIVTWRAAYAGLVPAAHLKALSLENRTKTWRRLLPENGRADSPKVADDRPPDDELTATWVATDAGGMVVGFADAGLTRDTDAVGHIGELRAIYVLPEAWGTGVGHTLHERAVEWLRQRRYVTASLWVLEGNARARQFYERHGWRLEGTVAPIELAGETVTEIRYELDLGDPAEAGPLAYPPPPTGPVGGS
jgi:GNAT superfamily N-acetyltransferase